MDLFSKHSICLISSFVLFWGDTVVDVLPDDALLFLADRVTDDLLGDEIAVDLLFGVVFSLGGDLADVFPGVETSGDVCLLVCVATGIVGVDPLVRFETFCVGEVVSPAQA